MEFSKALEIVGLNKYLLGKKYLGGTIDEIIIAPVNTEEYSQFMTIYSKTLDAQFSIGKFVNSEVEVFVIVDKQKIRTCNLLAIIHINDIKL